MLRAIMDIDRLSILLSVDIPCSLLSAIVKSDVLTHDAKVMARMSSAVICRRYVRETCFSLHWRGGTEMSIEMYPVLKLLTFSIRKNIESEQLAKRVVTFYNNEGGRVMKQTAAHFKKEKVTEADDL